MSCTNCRWLPKISLSDLSPLFTFFLRRLRLVRDTGAPRLPAHSFLELYHAVSIVN